MQAVQFGEAKAHAIAGFSISQVGWFVLFFVLAAGLMLLIFSGGFAGARAQWGGVLLGLLLVADLGRANQPWVIYWDYNEKYASNPIIDRLREKPYEHRVAMLPFRAPPKLAYAGPALSRPVAQTPVPVLQYPVARYHPDAAHAGGHRGLREGLNRAEGATNACRVTIRAWQLTNTRYLLGAAGFVLSLNSRSDPAHPPFRIAERFNIVPRPAFGRADRAG